MANPFRTSTNAQRDSDVTLERQRREDAARAGLALREQQIANQEAATAERATLDAAKFAFDKSKFQLEQGMKLRAREQAIKYTSALSGVQENDPDFETHVAALQAAFPLAAFDEDTKSVLDLKRKAAGSAKEARTKFFQDTGVDPDEFVARDKDGRYLKHDWSAIGKTKVERERNALIDKAKNLATALPFSTGEATVSSKVGDVTITAPLQTDLAKLNKGAGVLNPVIARTLTEEAGGSDVDKALNKGAADATKFKQEQTTNRNAQSAFTAYVQALRAKGASLADPATAAELEAKIKEFEAANTSTKKSWDETLTGK